MTSMNAMPSFDAELLERYERPAPRYTSYPTAAQFTTAFGETELRGYAQASNSSAMTRELSLYVHVPYCFSPCFYCGCNRLISRDPAKGATYLERLSREIALAAPLFDRRREVVQLHLGGGTPNFLRPGQIATLLATLHAHFNLSARASRDFSIELDPRFVRDSDVAQLADLGFNRASFGVQDFDPAVQRAVNRIQSVAQTLQAIQDCRESGFRSVNVDLICGLPRQTSAGFGKTLDKLLTVRPDRIAIYSYAHMPQLFKPQRRIDARELPDSRTKLQLLQLAIQQLEAAGYRHIGLDHFALPHDDLARALDAGRLHRNFMGYTTHSDCDLLGLGVSAISHIGASFSQNPRALADWEAAIDGGSLPVWRGVELVHDDEIRADVIQELMCKGQIDMGRIERAYGILFESYFRESLARLRPLATDGLVSIAGGYIRATPRGRLLMRVIAMCFDGYLSAQGASGAQGAQFSKVV